MLSEVLIYITDENEEIKIIHDEKTDRTIYWNLDTSELREIKENHMEDIKTTILEIVCENIIALNYISDFFTIDGEILESFEAQNKEFFIEDLKNFNIEIE